MPIACDRGQRRYRYLNALIDERANADRQLGRTHPDGAAVFLCSTIGEVAQLDADGRRIRTVPDGFSVLRVT